jgi:hypothetical protein
MLIRLIIIIPEIQRLRVSSGRGSLDFRWPVIEMKREEALRSGKVGKRKCKRSEPYGI